MWLTLALITLCTAILAVFAGDFSRLCKRFFSIPGMVLCAPLLLASLLVAAYQELIFIVLIWVRSVFSLVEHYIYFILPNIAAIDLLVRVILLTLIACTPILISLFLKTRQIISGARQTMYRIAVFSWVISAILFITV